MKKLFFIFFIVSAVNPLFGQTVKISAEPGDPGIIATRDISDKGQFPVSIDKKDFKTFSLQYSTLASGHKLKIEIAGTSIETGKSDEYLDTEKSTSKPFTFKDDITNRLITITEDDGTNKTPIIKFRFIKTNNKNLSKKDVPEGGGVITNSLEPLADFLGRILSDYELTPMGWIRTETGGMTEKEKRMQDNTTHIFFDEFGNSLAGAIPQGISNRQYVVHIIYRGFSNHQRTERYSVKQKSGSFSSILNINNNSALGKLPNNLFGDTEDTFDQWEQEIFPLGIATDNIVFDITVTTKTDDTGKPVKIVLETQTIKMSPVFHASIDFGLINSQLQNSTFALVDAPDGSANKVIKETDKSPKGIVTVMATFYTSPIVIIEKLFEKKTKKRIPSYKLTGRSYFDDHSFFERIYPTVGVSVSSKSFENLFFGLNWELARGLSVFGGGHWGKVNVFEKPDLISTTEVIPVTQAQFDFYQNTKWKIDWAYGIKLDISIITNIFKSN